MMICEPVPRHSMRFAPVKSIDQQARLTVYRVRQGYVQIEKASGAVVGRSGSGSRSAISSSSMDMAEQLA
jgi:hypothetical protein